MASDPPPAPDFHGFNVTRERRLEMAIELLNGLVQGAINDIAMMKRWHPASKRGSNYTRAMESLESRLATAEQECADVKST